MSNLKTNDFDFNLPDNLIAQYPCERRDNSKLFFVDRKNSKREHKKFYDIVDFFQVGDVLVLNDSKVIPARLIGKKDEGTSNIETFVVSNVKNNIWKVLLKPGKRVKIGQKIIFDDNFSCEVLGVVEDGLRLVEFYYKGKFLENLQRVGLTPLPPYINRKADKIDSDRYQTVYCEKDGSVAAPTAGLHFTEELLAKLQLKGVEILYVTLHVGLGTFRPVKADFIKEHNMHFEEFEISKEVASKINKAIIEDRRIVAVGTTVTRTLESASFYDDQEEKYLVRDGIDSTDIFIYPPYEFKIIKSLITNFHLPKSTLLMLISAFYSKEDILDIYKEAVEKEYRFFSYGDSLFLR